MQFDTVDVAIKNWMEKNITSDRDPLVGNCFCGTTRRKLAASNCDQTTRRGGTKRSVKSEAEAHIREELLAVSVYKAQTFFVDGPNAFLYWI